MSYERVVASNNRCTLLTVNEQTFFVENDFDLIRDWTMRYVERIIKPQLDIDCRPLPVCIIPCELSVLCCIILTNYEGNKKSRCLIHLSVCIELSNVHELGIS